MSTNVLISAACTIMGCGIMVIGCAHLLHVDNRIKARGHLYMAAAFVVCMLGSVLLHSPLIASLDAAGVAWSLWLWWNNGGGDGMKRRFKAWTESLGRRTAPQGA